MLIWYNQGGSTIRRNYFLFDRHENNVIEIICIETRKINLKDFQFKNS